MSERTTQQLVDRLNSSDPDFDDCTDAAIILLRQHAEIERLKRERQHIYDLLARIHRDGGQYTAENGVEKSCDDAEAQVVTWIDTISGIDSLIEQARIAERAACDMLQWAADQTRARSAS